MSKTRLPIFRLFSDRYFCLALAWFSPPSEHHNDGRKAVFSVYMHSGLDSYVEEDEWTHEPVLMSFKEWYEYKLEIKYTLCDHTFYKEVPYSSEYDTVHAGDKLFIKVNKSKPEKVLFISPQSEENGYDNFPLKFMLIGMVVFLVLLFILAKTIIYA